MGVYGFAPCIDNTYNIKYLFFVLKLKKKSTIKLSSLKNEYKNLGTFSFQKK